MKRVNIPGALINALIGCVGSFALILAAGCATPRSSGAQSSSETQSFSNSATNRGVFATGRLWHKTVHRPAANPHLRLSQAQQIADVLVEYDERTQESNRFQHRAYWLFANSNNVSTHLKPKFINPAVCTNLEPILLLELATTNNPPTNGYCAILITNECSFGLWQNGGQLGRFDLPVYRGAPRATAGRIALTPVCVIADVVTVAVVVVVAGAAAGAGGPMGY